MRKVTFVKEKHFAALKSFSFFIIYLLFNLLEEKINFFFIWIPAADHGGVCLRKWKQQHFLHYRIYNIGKKNSLLHINTVIFPQLPYFQITKEYLSTKIPQENTNILVKKILFTMLITYLKAWISGGLQRIPSISSWRLQNLKSSFGFITWWGYS